MMPASHLSVAEARTLRHDVRCQPSKLATVGHDLGRLVLRLRQRLAAPPERVRQAIGSEAHRDRWRSFDSPAVDDDDRGRWTVESVGSETLIEFVVFIPAEDLDRAAEIGVRHHLRFAHVLQSVSAAETTAAQDGCDPQRLVDGYASLFAAALADTD